MDTPELGKSVDQWFHKGPQSVLSLSLVESLPYAGLDHKCKPPHGGRMAAAVPSITFRHGNIQKRPSFLWTLLEWETPSKKPSRICSSSPIHQVCITCTCPNHLGGKYNTVDWLKPVVVYFLGLVLGLVPTSSEILAIGWELTKLVGEEQ